VQKVFRHETIENQVEGEKRRGRTEMIETRFGRKAGLTPTKSGTKRMAWKEGARKSLGIKGPRKEARSFVNTEGGNRGKFGTVRGESGEVGIGSLLAVPRRTRVVDGEGSAPRQKPTAGKKSRSSYPDFVSAQRRHHLRQSFLASQPE